MQLDSRTESTVVTALVQYGLSCVNGYPCVDALRAIGQDRVADVLCDELDARNSGAGEVG